MKKAMAGIPVMAILLFGFVFAIMAPPNSKDGDKMNCSDCPVTNRCINDGDSPGLAKNAPPCERESFYDPENNYCDRENMKVFGCYTCPKNICKNSGCTGW